MNRLFKFFIIILILLLLGLFLGVLMSNVEKPKYKSLSIDNNIELRQYDVIYIAEVTIESERKDAIKAGFKILANYIFGGNSENLKIAMTAPVKQQRVENSWKISFLMPAEYSLKTLPNPNDKIVKIKKITQKKYGVITFSGLNSDSNVDFHKNLLKKYLKKNNISTLNSAIYAFYNPPWTLPIFRRNEIMFEIL